MITLKTFLGDNTANIIKNEVEIAIKKYSKECGVDEKLIRAIIAQESAGVPHAVRYEPQLRKAEWYRKTLPEQYKEDFHAYCSMGYMQVLYGIAVSYGFKGSPHDLLSEDNSIKYGVLHLKKLTKTYAVLNDAIASYNMGSPKKFGPDNPRHGEYINNDYVLSVNSFLNKTSGIVGLISFQP